ncbi:MAG: SAM-dependent methyltransferase [Synechococcales cyanobacterium]
MVMKLDQVVPFGRSADEYIRMFTLTEADQRRTILGVGDGPASFNAELTTQGGQVTSVDPLYAFTAEEIQARFEAVLDPIMDQVQATPNDWVWSYHGSPAGLRHNRIRVMERFCQDYQLHRHSGRYVVGSLPQLPFNPNAFDLALCSHLLFLYSEQLSYAFHRQSILEMLRVAPEVRIFPLLTLMLTRSPHLDPIQEEVRAWGYDVRIQPTAYELQKGAREMLVITRPTDHEGIPTSPAAVAEAE